MSAVLSAAQLHPWTVTRVVPELWLNPHASTPLNAGLPFKTWVMPRRCGNSCDEEPGLDISGLLGLSADWPGSAGDDP